MAFNPLRAIAERTPAPLDALVEQGAGALDDAVQVARTLTGGGLPGNDIDAWDPDHIRRTLPLNRAITRAYFRAEVTGLDNIPAEGPALLVGNHSGGLMIADSFAFAFEFYAHFGPDRRFHQLAHDLAARQPLFGILRRYGTVAASHENAKKAFDAGAPVLVYPGGDWETFRPSWHSDRIEFGGRKGFIKLALEAGVPIVPVVAIGGQETGLFVTRGQRVAKALGVDRMRVKVLPISIGPPFGISILDFPPRLPLPAKIKVEVLPPIALRERFGPDPDPDAVYDEVTGEMQESLSDLADERDVPILG